MLTALSSLPLPTSWDIWSPCLPKSGGRLQPARRVQPRPAPSALHVWPGPLLGGAHGAHPFLPRGPPPGRRPLAKCLAGSHRPRQGSPPPRHSPWAPVRGSGRGGCREPRPRLTFVGVGEPDLGGGRVGAAVRLLRGGGGGAAGVCRGRGAQAAGEETAHEGGGWGAPHQAAAGCGYRGESQSGQAWRPHQGALRRGPSGPEPPKLPSSGTQDAEARAAGHSDT